MIIDLPWPPSVNHYWERRRDGKGVRIGARGLDFRRAVKACAIEQHAASFPDWPRVAMFAEPKPLRVQVDVYPPDNRQRDIGNLDKALMDALEHANVIIDDKWFHDSHYIRRPLDRPNGRIVMKIEYLTTDEVFREKYDPL